MNYSRLLASPANLVTNKGHEPIAKIFGVPFDLTTTFRPGARFGPNAIRQAFMNIETYSPQLNVDLERVGIEDLGNLKSTGKIEEMIYSVRKVVEEIICENVTCGILGGEHSLTFGAYLSVPKDTALIIFDAHLDLREEFSGLKLSHATFLRRLIDKIGVNSIIHIGSRAASFEEWKFADRIGLSLISTQMINTINNTEKILIDFLRGFKTIYVSIDLDVLDPAFAPSVSNPEPNGLSTNKLLKFLYSLKGKKIAGFDIVELTPLFDQGNTAVVAAKFMNELISLSHIAKQT